MIKLVRCRVARRLLGYHLFLRAGQLRLQRIGNGFCDVAFDRKDIGQLSIVNFGPEMRVRHRIDQLHVDPHLIVRFLDTAFENVQDAKLLRDVRQILRRALELLRRGPRNDFQVRYLRQPRQDLVLHAFGEKSVVGIAAEIVEWQNRDRFGG